MLDNKKYSLLLAHYHKVNRYNDEPFLYHYVALIKNLFPENKEGRLEDDWGSGISFNEDKARIKAVAETVERYCLSIIDKKRLKISSVNQLQQKHLDPSTIVGISPEQQKLVHYRRFAKSETSIYQWVNGYSLINKEQVLIPAQLVYVPYNYLKQEPVIRLPSSTGAACGESFEDAIYRGICEVIERDAFMIYFLNQLTPKELRINNKQSPYYDMYVKFQRYRLDLRIFNITTDIGVPVIMAILLDNTGVGPTISVGLKCSLVLDDAIIGATEEAQHTRGWMRDEMYKANRASVERLYRAPNTIQTAKDRGLFWYDGRYINHLHFWLRQRRLVPSFNNIENINHMTKACSKVEIIVNIMKKFNYDVVYTELSNQFLHDLGFHIVKVIVPALQPLYLDENYQYFGGERLYSVPRSIGHKSAGFPRLGNNLLPHPFL